MRTEIPRSTQDAVIDALASDDKDRAILLYHRASGKGLEEAWAAVQKLLLDLGSYQGSVPEKADDDPSYRRVRYYLSTDAAKRRKAVFGSFAIALLLLGVAAYILADHSPRLLRAINSFSWPTTEATVLKARSYTEERLDREFKRSRDFMDFVFRYRVEGVEYTDSRGRVQLYEAFGDRPFKPGDRFEVAYNPERPEETIFDRQIYDRIFAIGFGLLLLAVCLILAATEWSRMQSRRRLQQVDDTWPNPNK